MTDVLTLEREPFAFVGFEEMSNDELLAVDGGGTISQALGIVAGAVLIAWSPVVGILCPPVGAAMFLAGAAVFCSAAGLNPVVARW